jgi:hypothetical protein
MYTGTVVFIVMIYFSRTTTNYVDLNELRFFMYFITLIYLEVYFSITRGVLKAKGFDFLQAYHQYGVGSPDL